MTEPVTIAAINAVGVLILGVLVALINRNVNKYHRAVNGHMGKLLELTKKDGVQEGKDKQIAKQNKK